MFQDIAYALLNEIMRLQNLMEKDQFFRVETDEFCKAQIAAYQNVIATISTNTGGPGKALGKI